MVSQVYHSQWNFLPGTVWEHLTSARMYRQALATGSKSPSGLTVDWGFQLIQGGVNFKSRNLHLLRLGGQTGRTWVWHDKGDRLTDWRNLWRTLKGLFFLCNCFLNIWSCLVNPNYFINQVPVGDTFWATYTIKIFWTVFYSGPSFFISSSVLGKPRTNIINEYKKLSMILSSNLS